MHKLQNTVSRGLAATGRRFRRGSRAALAAGALLATAGAANAQGSAETLVTALSGQIGTVDEHMWTIGAAVAAVIGVIVVVTLLLRNGKKVATSS